MKRALKNLAALCCAALMLLGSARAEALNVLLIGLDGDGETGRSDTMMLCRIDEESCEVRLASFLRDLYVRIPGYGRTRLNAAYVYGGAPLLRQTLEECFGVTIDRSLTVNFSLLKSLVDDMGGVEITLTQAEARHLNETLGGAPDLKEGAQLLDGYQALSYSRIRKIDSDFQRTQRQQNVIRALVERARSLSWISLARLAVRYLGEVETDLSLGDLSALLPLARQADLSNLQSARVPFEGAYEEAVIDGMQVLVPDLEANRAQLAAFWDAP